MVRADSLLPFVACLSLVGCGHRAPTATSGMPTVPPPAAEAEGERAEESDPSQLEPATGETGAGAAKPTAEASRRETGAGGAGSEASRRETGAGGSEASPRETAVGGEEPEDSAVPEGQEPAPDPMIALSGEYRYIGGAAQREGISKAIESVTDSMSRLVRGVARKRLEASNRAPQKISIRADGTDVIVTLDGQRYRGRPGGPPVQVKNIEGGTSMMRLEIQKDRLYQTFVADEGQRTNVFAPYAEGRSMNLWVTVRSGRLPKPVKYRLTYTE